MSKLVLVLCLFSITALAKPSNAESDENTIECQRIRPPSRAGMSGVGSGIGARVTAFCRPNHFFPGGAKKLTYECVRSSAGGNGVWEPIEGQGDGLPIGHFPRACITALAKPSNSDENTVECQMIRPPSRAGMSGVGSGVGARVTAFCRPNHFFPGGAKKLTYECVRSSAGGNGVWKPIEGQGDGLPIGHFPRACRTVGR